MIGKEPIANYEFQDGGTLSANHPSYVEREADIELFERLKKGDFCYVLNSRQMGKSSLWVQTLQKLKKVNIASVAIDLTAIGRASVEEWYEGLAYLLADNLSLYWDIEWEDWWEEKEFLSPAQRFSQFLEKVIINSLPSNYEKVVIFIDEIDFVRSLLFKSDDFFALIRACYNARASQPKYNRLTFCLLGVATPSDLIDDKQVTPFNIGNAIELKGFRLEEVESLIKGLEGKVIYPESVMSDVLYWTGGQPFLTQRLCNLVVQESNPTPDVSQIVQSNIIDNWETQDEKQHLKTIKNRILSNEHRAGYLLELYRKVLTQEKVTINNSSEETELKLSGLVVKKGNFLQVYNPIYAKVFNETWIDTELNKLRPYSENYRAWLQSGKSDESRLLQGQALVEAEKWANGKNLGGEDRDFLGASHAKERAIEIEKKEKKAVEQRNILLEEANEEAKKKIQRGTVIGASIFGIMLIVASGLGIFAWQAKNGLRQAKLELQKIEHYIVSVDQLNTLAQQLGESEKQKITNLLEQLPKIENSSTKVLLKLAIQALAYVYLEDLALANSMLDNSFNLVYVLETEIEDEALLPIKLLLKKIKGDLKLAQGQSDQSFKYYNDAVSLLKSSQYNPYQSSYNIFSEDMIVDIHEKLMEKPNYQSSGQMVEASLFKHYKQRTQNYVKQLETTLKQKNWREADRLTWIAIYYSAQSNKIDRYWNWRDTSCHDFKHIDNLWYNHSEGKFSFKEQWKIYARLNNNPPEYKYLMKRAFAKEVGWYTQETGWKSYKDLNWSKNSPKISPRGHLPRPRRGIARAREGEEGVEWVGWGEEVTASEAYGYSSLLSSKCL